MINYFLNNNIIKFDLVNNKLLIIYNLFIKKLYNKAFSLGFDVIYKYFKNYNYSNYYVDGQYIGDSDEE
jgi:hypothetical protein